VFTITVETQFKAKHSIALPDGSREPEHEHFWAVSVEINADKLDDNGMVMDFAQLKARLNNITSKLTGAVLNNIDYFHKNRPTSESVAVYVFEQLEPNLPERVRLESVMVSEQVGCMSRYRKDR
jgi:6-pyruvoyltetrahydropterin/6-carboxytetrahydropterin synthase